MTNSQIFWAICGVVALMICVTIAVQKKRWKWFFSISWPIIVALGPIGLIMATINWYGDRPYSVNTTVF